MTDELAFKREFGSFVQLEKGGFRWLASCVVASANWIPWIPQKNPARRDRDSASL